MDYEKHINHKKEQYDKLLDFLEGDLDFEDYDEDLIENFQNKKNVNANFRQELQSFLLLLSTISYNHSRKNNLIGKIEKIILFLRDQIKQTFSNIEIFQFFSENNRVLFFLFSQKIITFENKILLHFVNNDMNKYYIYFFNEISGCLEPKLKETIERKLSNLIPDIISNFDEYRLNGENEMYMCNLIRNDSIEDFVSYINRTNTSLSSVINKSIFETNQYLISNNPTLIEYATFFGSIQIFQYLRLNGVVMKSSLWFYAIHGGNPEIIHLIEEYVEKPDIQMASFYLMEAIKCHHNDIAEYIINNYLDDKNRSFLYPFKYYNFHFFPNDFTDSNSEITIDFTSLFDTVDLLGIHRMGIKYNTSFLKFLFNNKIISIEYNKDKSNQITQFTIPSFVTEIENNLFRKLVSLKNVLFEDNSSILNIGKAAFRDCSSLTEIKLPSSLQNIDDLAFDGCTSLSKIEFEKKSSLKSIGCRAFERCFSLKSIELPPTVNSIDSFVFFKCTKLNYFQIPSSLTVIESNIFDECIGLTEIIIPSSVTLIGSNAFKSCKNLKKVTFSSSLIKIDSFAFYRCSSLNQLIFEKPSSLAEIGEGAFEYCTSLMDFAAPSSLVMIGDLSFAHCTSLHAFRLEKPTSIKSIGKNVFYNCQSLNMIELPNSVNPDKLNIEKNVVVKII